MSWYIFLWVYFFILFEVHSAFWICRSFAKLWKFSSHSFFEYFFLALSCFSSLSGMPMNECRSFVRDLQFLEALFSVCSDWVISVVLPSSSLILFSFLFCYQAHLLSFLLRLLYLLVYYFSLYFLFLYWCFQFFFSIILISMFIVACWGTFIIAGLK